MEEVIKSYKGFNKDMTCRGFQFEEGKEYEEEKAEACECGFHACEYPLDVFGYYNPAKSVFHDVVQSGASINIAGLVKAAIEYTTKRVKKENDSDSDYGASSATGYKGASSATGDYGASSATGTCGASSATGYKSCSEAGDKESVAVAWGYKSKAKGVKGSYIVFADWEGDEREYYKPDTWTLKGAKWYRSMVKTSRLIHGTRLKTEKLLRRKVRTIKWQTK